VTDEEAISTARRLAAEGGIFAGFSSGANVAAALQLLRAEDRDQTVVTLACDSYSDGSNLLMMQAFGELSNYRYLRFTRMGAPSTV
jgi:hypothetical protein